MVPVNSDMLPLGISMLLSIPPTYPPNTYSDVNTFEPCFYDKRTGYVDN